jgi:adenylate kinase
MNQPGNTSSLPLIFQHANYPSNDDEEELPAKMRQASTCSKTSLQHPHDGLFKHIVIALALLGSFQLASSAHTVTKTSQRSRTNPWGVTSDRLPQTEINSSNRQQKLVPTVVQEQICDVTIEQMTETKDHAHDNVHLDVREPLKIIIMGGPASGKGSQCERISQQFNVVHLSTGDMLREAVRKQTALGMIAKKYMDAGQLVPDNVIIQVVLDRISQPDCLERGWLLDGFPRTKAQAEALSKMGIEADLFLFLNVPDEVLIERVVGRRTDPVTSKIYHLKFLPPPDDVKDRLVQRSDDTVEKMKKRLEQFHQNVNAVRSYYDDVMVEVDGSVPIDQVYHQISEAIWQQRRPPSLKE